MLKNIFEKLFRDKFYFNFWVLDRLEDIFYNVIFRFYFYFFELFKEFLLLKFEVFKKYLEILMFWIIRKI